MPLPRAPRPLPSAAVPSGTSTAACLGFVSILGLLGCSDSATPGETRVRDSAGVRIVEHGAVVAAPPEWPMTDVPTFLLGDSESDTLQQFQLISHARRLGDGRYVVLDGIESTLRYFAPDGRHLLTAGRQGEGPGELLYPYLIIPLAGDTIAIPDNGNQRLSIFDPSGAFARSYRKELVQGRTVSLVGRLGDSMYLGRFSLNEPLPAEGDVITSALLVRLTDSVTAIDTMMRHRVAEAFVLPQGRDVGLARNAFHAYGTVVTSGDGIVYVWSKEPEVRRYSPEGRLERLVRLGHTTRPFTAELRRSWMQQTLDQLPSPESQRRFQRLWTDRPTPDSLPVYSDVLVDEEGYIWLGHFELLEHPVREWTVLDSAGHLAAMVRTPWHLRIMQIGENYVLGAMRTELDVPTLVVFGLDRRP